MRKLKNCPGFYNRLLRGFALGCCYSLLGLVFAISSGFSAKAAEIPAIESEIENTADLEDDNGESVDDTDTIVDGAGTVSGGDSGGQISTESQMDLQETNVGCTCAETLAVLLEVDTDETQVYTSLEEFEASPATVDRYEYEILERLEFLQYSQMILIGLIFVLIFKKK